MVDSELTELIHSNEDPEDIFELIDLIGELIFFLKLHEGFGSFGLVYKALQKTTGEIFAIKIVNVAH